MALPDAAKPDGFRREGDRGGGGGGRDCSRRRHLEMDQLDRRGKVRPGHDTRAEGLVKDEPGQPMIEREGAGRVLRQSDRVEQRPPHDGPGVFGREQADHIVSAVIEHEPTLVPHVGGGGRALGRVIADSLGHLTRTGPGDQVASSDRLIGGGRDGQAATRAADIDGDQRGHQKAPVAAE
jgi:hypothetical protein